MSFSEVVGLVFVALVLIAAIIGHRTKHPKRGAPITHQNLGTESNAQKGDRATIGFFRAELARLRHKPRNFGNQLEGFSLIGADLSGLDLSGYWLSNCNFTDAKLLSVNLQDARLSDVDFSSANLHGANITYVSTYGVIFAGARLNEAQLMGAELATADMNSCTLIGAQFDFITQWPFGFDPEKYGAMSIDGLGPRSFELCVTGMWKEDMVRSINRVYAVAAAKEVGTRNAIRHSDIRKKLAQIMSPESKEARDNWLYRWTADRKPDSEHYGSMSLDDYFYFAARDILYHKIILSEHKQIEEMLKKIIVRRYTRAWEDYLEIRALEQHDFRAIESGRLAVGVPVFESPLEEIFWNEWQKQGGSSIVELVYQFQPAETRYRVDFAHLPTLTAIELDGYEFHSSKERFTHDRRRQRELERLGWRFIRFSGSEVTQSPTSCFTEVMQYIEAAVGTESGINQKAVTPLNSQHLPRNRSEIIAKFKAIATGGDFDVVATGGESQVELEVEGVYCLAGEDMAFVEALGPEHVSLASVRTVLEIGATWASLLEDVERRHAAAN